MNKSIIILLIMLGIYLQGCTQQCPPVQECEECKVCPPCNCPICVKCPPERICEPLDCTDCFINQTNCTCV